MKRYLTILFLMFGFQKIIRRWNLVRWLFNFLFVVLRQCDKTADLWERFVFYKKALVATFRLYRLLVEEEKKNKQTKRD